MLQQHSSHTTLARPGSRSGTRPCGGQQQAFSSPCLRRRGSQRLSRPSRGPNVAAAAASTAAGPSAQKKSTPSEEECYDCVVVGAGISGLVTAQAFMSDHSDAVKSFLVTEERERVGGNITSKRNDKGFQWEEGPNSFQPSDAMLKAAVDAGVADQLVLGDPKAPRFVYWDKKLRPTPSGPDVLTFDLLSLWGKLRAGLGAVGIKKQMPANEESVEQFVRRNLGAEVFERLIEPFCSGVYAGDPAKLSMKAAFGKVYNLEREGGSIIGGVLKLLQAKRKDPGPPRDPRLPPKPAGQTVGSFREGLATLPDAIAAKLGDRVRLRWELRELEKRRDGTFTLLYKTPDGNREVRARCVALTVPAYIAADLVRRECPDASLALKGLDYPPVSAVTVAYPLSSIRSDRLAADGSLPGFGQLHPRSQGIVTLGTIYSSSLFPGRAPEGMVELLCYVGGATNRGVQDQSPEALRAQVDKDLREMVVARDAPPAELVAVRTWPKAIPQFNVNHLETVESAREDLREAGWDSVRLGGNYVAGVALGKCVEYAYEFAADVAGFLGRQQPQQAPGGSSGNGSGQQDNGAGATEALEQDAVFV